MNAEDTLKNAILTSRLTVAEVARAAGIAHPILSRFLHGQRTLKLPTVERLMKWAGLELRPADAGGAPPCPVERYKGRSAARG